MLEEACVQLGTSQADVSAVAVHIGHIRCKSKRQGSARDRAGAARGSCKWSEGPTWEMGRRTRSRWGPGPGRSRPL